MTTDPGALAVALSDTGVTRHIDIRALVSYKSWADNLLYEALCQLSEDELKKQRPMLFGNILALLNHVYAMDIVWRSNLLGIAHDLQTRNPKDVPSFSTLRSMQSEINSWYQDYTAQLSKDQLKEVVNVNFIGGGKGQLKKQEILHHVVNHASYHRGHIEGVMYQMAIEPPTTDIPVFLKTEKPDLFS